MQKLVWNKQTFKKLLPFIIEAVVFAFIIIFDLTMKDYLFKFLSGKPAMNYTVIDGFLDLTYSENTGAGFGLFKDSTLALTIITAIVIAAVIVYLIVVRTDKEWLRIPLVMIAAGGVGNLVDRIMLGYVRDFFEFTFMDFAIFNIADAFVTVGALALIIYLVIMLIGSVTNKNKSGAAEEGAVAPAGDEASVNAAEDAKDRDTEEAQERLGDPNGEL